MTNLQIIRVSDFKLYLPLVTEKITAGFPSPASSYEESDIDINDIVVTNPTSTFYIRVKGNSMIDANIKEGDILVVDRSKEAAHGDIIIAVINGEFTVKTLYHKDGVVKLVPANQLFSEIILKSEEELQVWGVVTYSITQHKNSIKMT